MQVVKYIVKIATFPQVDEDVVVAVLKGIRNIRHLEDNVIDKLVHCANDNAVKARVRVAALEAFLADPCAAKVRDRDNKKKKGKRIENLSSEIEYENWVKFILKQVT